MSLPVPKFNIGDRVYFITTTRTYKRLPCPDCLGEGKWKVISPAGMECATDCPRCKQRWNDIPSLDIPHYESTVTTLTIGSIQINTAEYDHVPVKYMCVETGVGSGSVYKESDLFADKNEADLAAKTKAAAQTAVAQEEPQAMAAKTFSYLSIEAACFEALRSAVFHSWYAYQELMEKIDDYLKEFSEVSKDDLRSEVDFEKRYRQGNSSQPFDVLIRAAKKYADADPDIAKALKPFAEPNP